MFTAGLGFVRDNHLKKQTPSPGDLICKVGGPVYRIGLGGGSASSSSSQASLDTSAVQREDPQMEQKMNRLLRFVSNVILIQLKLFMIRAQEVMLMS